MEGVADNNNEHDEELFPLEVESRFGEQQYARGEIVKIKDVEVGQTFKKRLELSRAGIHPPPMAGIYGTVSTGAISLVVSGGYEDDIDNGYEIVYTGSGKLEHGKQVADQKMERGNAALAESYFLQNSIHVTRGCNLGSAYAPAEGYRYDGCYVVDKYWQERGQSGFKVWRYRLLRVEGQPPLEDPLPIEKRKTTKLKYTFKAKISPVSSLFSSVRASSPSPSPTTVVKRTKKRKVNDKESEDVSIKEDLEITEPSEPQSPRGRTTQGSQGQLQDLLRMYGRFEDLSLLRTWICAEMGTCVVCMHSVNHQQFNLADKMLEHMEKHKEDILNKFAADDLLFIMCRRMILNQGRIRSVLEEYEEDLEDEEADTPT